MRGAVAVLLVILTQLLAASSASAAGVLANHRPPPLERAPDHPGSVRGLAPSEAEIAPAPGSFLQRDPSGYKDSVNLYAFAGNDPVNHRDPTGRFWNLAAGAVIGGVVGGVLDIAHQWAEARDAGREFDVDWGRSGTASLKGAATGLAVAACPVCGVGLSVVGVGAGSYAATTQVMAGNYRTAALDAAGAVLSGVGGAKLNKAIANGQVAKVDPNISKALGKLAAPAESEPTFGPNSVGAAQTPKPKVLQSTGNTIKPSTARKLGLTPEQARDAMHRLKPDVGAPPKMVGKIMSNGDYVHPETGEVLGNLYDYVTEDLSDE